MSFLYQVNFLHYSCIIELNTKTIKKMYEVVWRDEYESGCELCISWFCLFWQSIQKDDSCVGRNMYSYSFLCKNKGPCICKALIKRFRSVPKNLFGLRLSHNPRHRLYNQLHADTVNCFNTTIAGQCHYPLTSLYHKSTRNQ